MTTSAIPANIRLPLFYAEVNAALLPTPDPPNSTLILGPTYEDLTDSDGRAIREPISVPSVTRFIADNPSVTGTPLEHMVRTYKSNDPNGDLFVAPLSGTWLNGEVSGTRASSAWAKTVLIWDPATQPASGTMYLDFFNGGTTPSRVTLTWSSAYASDNAAAIALRDAINTANIKGIFANTLTNTATDGSVEIFAADVEPTVGGTTPTNNILTFGTGTTHYANTLNVLPIGTIGNQFKVRYSGGGDALIKVGSNFIASGTDTQLAGATATHSHVQEALTDADGFQMAIEEGNFDYLVLPTADAADLAAVDTLIADRWGYRNQRYGHAWCGKNASVSALQTAYGSLDYATVSVVGIDGIDAPDCVIGASVAGAAALSLRADPALPLHTVPVGGLGTVPRYPDRFTFTERNTLLNAGISLIGTTPNNSFQILRVVTMDSDRWRNVEQRYVAMAVVRRLRTAAFRVAGRAKIANDGSLAAAATNVVTPSEIRNALIDEYRTLGAEGIVDDQAAFERALIVVRNPSDPNRVDIALDANQIDQLQVLAAAISFV